MVGDPVNLGALPGADSESKKIIAKGPINIYHLPTDLLGPTNPNSSLPSN